MVIIFQWYVGFIDPCFGDPNAIIDGTKPAIAQHIAMVHTILTLAFNNLSAFLRLFS